MNCKIIETDRRHCQQILVRLDNNDDGDLCIIITFWPEDGPVFTVSQAIAMKPGEAAEEKARTFVRDCTEDEVIQLLSPSLDLIDEHARPKGRPRRK